MSRWLRLGGRLDRLTLRRFIESYVVVTAGTLAVGWMVEIVAGAVEQPMGDMASLWSQVKRASLALPVLYFLSAPLGALLAAQWTLATAVLRNEVGAVYGAGVSARRIAAPLLFAVSLLTVASTRLRDPIFTAIEQMDEQLDNQQGPAEDRGWISDIWLRDHHGLAVHIDRFRPATQGSPATILGLDTDRFDREQWRHIHALRATYVAGRWQLEGGTQVDRTREGTIEQPVAELFEHDFLPEDVRLAHRADRSPLSLTSAQVADLHARSPFDTRWLTLIEVHRASPWSGVVLVMIGACLILSAGPGRLAQGVAGGLITALGYICLDLLVRLLGLGGRLGPIWTGWLPLLTFGSLAIMGFITLDGRREWKWRVR